MKIALGSDHTAIELKNVVRVCLEEKGHEIIDVGTHSEARCDYPVYGEAAAREVASGRAERGIIFCGTGVGISLAANKVRGIRCVNCSETYSARMSRMHNDSNMLSLGARVVGQGLALEIVEAWMAAEFEGDRHASRVRMIHEIETKA